MHGNYPYPYPFPHSLSLSLQPDFCISLSYTLPLPAHVSRRHYLSPYSLFLHPMDPTKSINHDSRVTVSGGREDCWSEGATEVLIEAWGDRYVSLNRGNLRQKDWKEVADAVNSRQNGAKAKRTDIQCKNRIDTLKKKYKIEKAKQPSSKWPFYYRLGSLIGTTKTKKKKSKLNPYSSSSLTETTSFDDDDDDDVGFDERVVKKQQRMEDVACSDGAACRELARAILKFGEIYERTESCKQQQMLELEKQRMEFTKQIEFEKLNMLMDAQLELQKKALKFNASSTSGKKL